MAHLDELLNKKHVASHPLIKGLRAKHAESLRIQRATAQAYTPPEVEDEGLSDMFSKQMEEEEQGLDGGDQKLSTLIFKSSEAVQELLGQFNFPYPPQLKFLNTYGVKRAATDEDKVVNAEIRLEAKIETLTGARRYLEIPVHVVRGSIVPPSVVYFDGREKLLTQGLVDHIIHTATAYQMDPIRENWASPMVDRGDLSMYVDVRNERGYQPREYDEGFMTVKTSRRRRAQEFDRGFTTEEFNQGVEEAKAYLAEEYEIEDIDRFLEVLAVLSATYKVGVTYYTVTPESAEAGGVEDSGYEYEPENESGFDAVNTAQRYYTTTHEGADWWYSETPWEENYETGEDKYLNVHIENLEGVGRLDKSTDIIIDDAINERLPWDLDDIESVMDDPKAQELIKVLQNSQPDPNQLKLFASRKKAIKSGVPSGWDSVVELMEKANEDGTDTFPRSYQYLLRNYILEVLPCVDNNHWEISLVNAGWCLNPYGNNRGRMVAARKKAQNLSEIDHQSFNALAEKIADELFAMLNFESYSHEDAGQWILENYPEATPSDLLSAVTLYINSTQRGPDWQERQTVDITDSQIREMFGDRLASKKAQALDDFELELEVAGDPVEYEDLDLPGEDYDIGPDVEDDQPQLLEWFYDGTKTPIEHGDNIKFEAHDGPIRAQIVELQEDKNCVIVKSKGTEYRVHVEDISPLDSTFKKMYL